MFNGIYFYTAIFLFISASLIWILGLGANIDLPVVGVLFAIGIWLGVLFCDQAYPDTDVFGTI